MGTISPLLAVRNMAATIDFYSKALGFKAGMAFPNLDDPEYIDLSKDGMTLMFIPASGLGLAGEEKLGLGVSLYLRIDGDIDEYCQELKARGVAISAEIKDEPFGIRDFTVEDVDGYRLTFNQVSKGARTCMSCGMPMTKAEDFGGGNPANVYCVNCSDAAGNLKSREEVWQGMVSFMMKTQGLEREKADQAARDYMAGMPAWRGN